MDIHEIINKIYPIPEASMDKLTNHLSKVTYPKGYQYWRPVKLKRISFLSRKGLSELIFLWMGKKLHSGSGKRVLPLSR